MFELSNAVVAASTGGLDFTNLEVWVVLTNVAIVVATLMLTKATVKDAQLHEEKVMDKANATTHDLTEIVHDVLVQEGRILAETEKAEKAEDSKAEPLRAVK